MAEEEEEFPHIVIDNGTRYSKVGFSGEEGPRGVFPTCIGYNIGCEAENNRGEFFKIVYPIENGVIYNWDDMEKIWDYIFTYKLRVDPVEHNVMLTESPMNTRYEREKMAQHMFETFNVGGLYIANKAVLPLYNAGNFTGIVVDSGEHATYIVSIFDRFSLPQSVIDLDLGGNDLTEFMMKLLDKTGYRATTSAEKEIARYIKEKACYVALDFEEEFKSVEPFDYELPDGSHLIIKDQRIRCPEVLFKPDMINKNGNISQACVDSIQKCDIDIRKDLYNCIVLSGGNSMYKGLPERFTKVIKSLAPESMKEEIKIIASPEGKFATWIGGCILTSIPSFECMWITKTEYEENGEYAVHRKCF